MNEGHFQHTPPKARRKRWPRRLIAAIIILVLAGVATFAIFQSIELHKLRSNPQQVSQKEAEELVAEVGKHLSLPDERPTVATVEDATKLRTQSFFKNAQNGDKVLIYTETRRAYLYRPAERKVIEVAALNITEQGQPQN